MIEELKIRNFRCFRDLTVSGLRRINVIVGQNAAGKSSFLEAAFLVCGASPDLALRLRGFRGLTHAMQIPADRDSFEDLWRDLFWQLDAAAAITIAATGSPALTRTVEIAFRGEAVVPIAGNGAADPRAIVPLVFSWREADGRASQVEVTPGPAGLNLSEAGKRTSAVAYVPAGVLFNAVENARQYSRLSKAGREAEVKDAVRAEYPFIQDLSVEDSGGNPVLYAEVESLRRKLPLGMVSEGVNRFTAYVIAAATLDHGVLCLDEVEGGMYFDRMAEIWPALLRLARRHDLQILATTHSLECVRALGGALADNQQEFTLLRAERSEAGCRFRRFDGAQLQAAVEEQVEVR